MRAYFLKKPITVPNTRTPSALNNKNKKLIFKNYAPFTNCRSEIKNEEVDHAKDIYVVMPMYDLIEYSDSYSKTSGSLWQYYQEESIL